MIFVYVGQTAWTVVGQMLSIRSEASILPPLIVSILEKSMLLKLRELERNLLAIASNNEGGQISENRTYGDFVE